jgi:hypothetical protein
MSKRLTVALVGCAAVVGCGVVAVSGNKGDAAVEPARAAVVSPENGAPRAVRWRSAPKLPALAPRRTPVALRHPRAAAAGQAAAAQPPIASAPPAEPVAPAASAPAPVAPVPVTPPPPAPEPAAPPPVDFLSSG